MSNSPAHFSGESGQLPEDVRRAFLEILYYSLLHVRSHCDQRDLCFTLSDHAHNIPGFLRDPKPELLCFYWECERAGFIPKMESLGHRVAVFDAAWKTIEQEYERVKTQAVA
ncbi:MAG TPA: hypothetical protein VN673_11235 [Clostridia bacterium]|nr:hypothetical protein [Clostridia bacterium]